MRAGAGGGIGFFRPSDQSIFTNGSANTITTSSPSVAVQADGVSIGSTASSPPYNLSWTPGAKDLDVSLTATGSGDVRKLAVADASNVSSNLSTWTATNVTVTSGQPDYLGGTSGYKIQSNTSAAAQHHISFTPSPVNTVNGTSLEFVVESVPTTGKLYILFGTAAGNRQAIWDFTTGNGTQSSLNKCYMFPVENLGAGKYRFWAGISDAQLATSARIYLTNTMDILSAASVSLTTTDAVTLSNVRMVDGLIPFYTRQKSGMYRNGASPVTGTERWQLFTEFNSSMTDFGQTTMYVDVLKPDSYVSSQRYRVVYLMPVEGTPASYNNELQVIKDLGLHNSMDCIWVRPWFYNNRTWGGKKNDGTIDHDTYISVMLPALIDANYSTQANREGRTLFGYSAGGFASVTQMNRSPTVWGYCVAWDGPWSAAFAAYDQAQHFGTDAQYQTYRPLTNFSASGWSGKCRLILGGANTFVSDYAAMETVVRDAMGGPMNDGGGDYATTITNPNGKWWKLYKDTSAGGAVGHNFLSDWVTPAAAALRYIWTL